MPLRKPVPSRWFALPISRTKWPEATATSRKARPRVQWDHCGWSRQWPKSGCDQKMENGREAAREWNARGELLGDAPRCGVDPGSSWCRCLNGSIGQSQNRSMPSACSHLSHGSPPVEAHQASPLTSSSGWLQGHPPSVRTSSIRWSSLANRCPSLLACRSATRLTAVGIGVHAFLIHSAEARQQEGPVLRGRWACLTRHPAPLHQSNAGLRRLSASPIGSGQQPISVTELATLKAEVHFTSRSLCEHGRAVLWKICGNRQCGFCTRPQKRFLTRLQKSQSNQAFSCNGDFDENAG